jgi:hypothetical protein
MQRVLAAAVAATAIAVSIGGCGGSSHTTDEAAAVVFEWNLAVAQRRVDQACRLMDAEGQAMLRRELAGFVAAHETGPSCPSLVGFLHDAVMTPQQRSQFGQQQSTQVSIKGEQAMVHASGGDFWLTRSDGHWYISELPLATSN